MHRSGSVALSLDRRPIWPCCRNQNETVALFYEVNAWPWCLLAEPSHLLGTTISPIFPCLYGYDGLYNLIRNTFSSQLG
jgi:hypothetical protein